MVHLSNGTSLSKANAEANIRVTKSLFVAKAERDKKTYCWACGTPNDRLSCSHIISVRECNSDGRAEKAWDMGNLQLECMTCHPQTESGNIKHHANCLLKERYMESYYNTLKQ